MSSIVSRRPSLRNQSKEAFWMSMRFGRSRTCFRREKLLRARGAATMVVKVEISLPYGSEGGNELGTGETSAEPPSIADIALPRQGKPRGWAACSSEV